MLASRFKSAQPPFGVLLLCGGASRRLLAAPIERAALDAGLGGGPFELFRGHVRLLDWQFEDRCCAIGATHAPSQGSCESFRALLRRASIRRTAGSRIRTLPSVTTTAS